MEARIICGMDCRLWFVCCCLLNYFLNSSLSHAAGDDIYFSDGFDSIRVYTPCGISETYAKVGFQGNLTSLDPLYPNISGLLTAYDDCYFSITKFKFPSTSLGFSFWSTSERGDNLTFAAPINPEMTTLTNWTGAKTFVIYIEGGGLTWDNIGVVYLLCNFCGENGTSKAIASVTIDEVEYDSAVRNRTRRMAKAIQTEAATNRVLASPPPPSPSPPPPSKENSTAGSGPGASFRNCIQGYPNRLNIYWTVEKEGEGEYWVEFGLEARVGDNSWAGFGFSGNQAKAQSLFADVTITGILSSDPKGFATDFYITAQNTCTEGPGANISGVCQDSVLGNSPSLNNVNLTAATRVGDVSFVSYRKKAKTADVDYDVDLMSSPTIFGNWYVVYATGPLAPGSTNLNPIPLNHDESYGYFKGGTRISLNPSSEPVFSCSALYGTKPLYHPPLPPYTAPPQAAPPPPPNEGLQELSTCVTPFGGQDETFSSCSILPGGFTFLWTLRGSSISAAFVAQMTGDSYWAAVGVSPTGEVAGSSLLAGYKSTATGEVDLAQYFVSRGSGGVLGATPGGNLSISGVQGQLENGILTLLFSAFLPSDQVAAAYLVWARGSGVNETGLSDDGVQGTYTSAISFQGGEESGEEGSKGLAWRLHGSLCGIAFGVLLPIGALLGRYVRLLSPYWFPLHQGCQLAGYWMAQVGFVTGLTMANRSAQTAHLAMGIVLFSFTTLQAMAVLWRPSEQSRWRRMWGRYHLCLGISILLLSVGQIFLGLHLAHAPRLILVAYIVWLALLLVTVAALELQPYIPGFRDVPLFRPPPVYDHDDHDREPYDEYYGYGDEATPKLIDFFGGLEEGDDLEWANSKQVSAEDRTKDEERKKKMEEGKKRDGEEGSRKALALWEELKKQVGDPDVPPPLHMTDEMKKEIVGSARQAMFPGRYLESGKHSSGEIPRRSPSSKSLSGQLKKGEISGELESGDAKFLRLESANEAVDRRSGEMGVGVRSPKPKTPSPTKGVFRSTSFSGQLGEAIRRLTRIPSKREPKQPVIKTDKYNVKATVAEPLDFATFKNQFARFRKASTQEEEARIASSRPESSKVNEALNEVKGIAADDGGKVSETNEGDIKTVLHAEGKNEIKNEVEMTEPDLNDSSASLRLSPHPSIQIPRTHSSNPFEEPLVSDGIQIHNPALEGKESNEEPPKGSRSVESPRTPITIMPINTLTSAPSLPRRNLDFGKSIVASSPRPTLSIMPSRSTSLSEAELELSEDSSIASVVSVARSPRSPSGQGCRIPILPPPPASPHGRSEIPPKLDDATL